MSNPFFDHPILNSPYEYPRRHWELDAQGQPTRKIVERCRRADFITPKLFNTEYPNLPVKKIPKQVLSRCEWGRDDYSLKVENLPKAPKKPGQQELEI